MLRIKLFDGVEGNLVIYNRQAIINLDIQFYSEECDDDLLYEEEDFTFPGYVSSYLRIYNERIGRLIKDIVLAQSGGSLILNASVLDMTFEDNGNYYFEIGYVQSGGYEQVLKYGIVTIK